MYEIIGKITVIIIIALLVFRFFKLIASKIQKKKMQAIIREKEIKDFQNKIIDEDLKKEWITFLKNR